MQKAAAGFDRAKEDEKDFKREQKRAEKVEREYERLKGELVQQTRKANEIEQQLR